MDNKVMHASDASLLLDEPELKDERIAHLEEEEERLTQVVSRLEQKLSEAQSKVDSLTSRLQSKEGELSAAMLAIKQKDEQIQQLTQDNGSEGQRLADQVEQLERKLSEVKSRIESSGVVLSEKNAEIHRLSMDLGEEVERREQLQCEIRQLTARILEEGWHSWKSKSKWGSKKSSECDEDGNPWFFHKCMDYVNTGDVWALLEAKYLFTHRKKIECNAKDTEKKMNLLIYCCSKPELSDMVEWLLEEGSIYPGETTDDERKATPLMLAAQHGCVRAVELLLKDKRVDLNAADSQGVCALMLAAIHNHPLIVALLKNHGCDISRFHDLKFKSGNKYRPNILHECAKRSECEEMIEWILKYGGIDPNIRTDDAFEMTALMYAAHYNNIEDAELLLKDERVLKDAADADGGTALMHAVCVNDLPMASLLLKYECNPNLRNRLGLTALDIAKQAGLFEMVYLLESVTDSS